MLGGIAVSFKTEKKRKATCGRCRFSARSAKRRRRAETLNERSNESSSDKTVAWLRVCVVESRRSPLG